MLSIPFGRIILSPKIVKYLKGQLSVEQQVEILTDLIEVRIKKKPITDLADGLLAKIFDLRFDLLELIHRRKGEMANYEEDKGQINESKYEKLLETISNVIKVHNKIFDISSGSMEPLVEENKFPIFFEEKPNYDTLGFFSNHPSPPIKYLKKWIDSSLELELGLFISNLVFSGKLDLTEKRINEELIPYLRDSITREGAYSIITGFWKPSKIDKELELINRIEILVSTIELDNKQYHSISKSELEKLINL